MDDFFDGFEEGFEGDWEDFDDGGYEEGDYDGADYEDRFCEDGDGISDEDERWGQDDQQADEGWISPTEASILGYGFGYEEGRAERRRRRQLRQDARIERFRQNRRGRRNRYNDDSEIF